VQDYANLHLPNVERICDETGVVLMHRVLLGAPELMHFAAREHLAAQEAAQS